MVVLASDTASVSMSKMRSFIDGDRSLSASSPLELAISRPPPGSKARDPWTFIVDRLTGSGTPSVDSCHNSRLRGILTRSSASALSLRGIGEAGHAVQQATIKRGDLIVGGSPGARRVPQPKPQLPKTDFAEIERRLDAARKRLEEISQMVWR